jgi:hypothetical protein
MIHYRIPAWSELPNLSGAHYTRQITSLLTFFFEKCSFFEKKACLHA